MKRARKAKEKRDLLSVKQNEKRKNINFVCYKTWAKVNGGGEWRREMGVSFALCKASCLGNGVKPEDKLTKVSSKRRG